MGRYRQHQRTAKRCAGCERPVSAPHAEGCSVATAKATVRHENIEGAALSQVEG